MGLYVSEEVEILAGLNISDGIPLADRTSDGGWIVTWKDTSGSLVTQKVDATGAPVGSKVVVYGGDGFQLSTSINALSDGGWVQVFTTTNGGTLQHVMRYDSSGQLVSSQQSGGYAFPNLLELGGDHYVSFSSWRLSDYAYEISASFFDDEGNLIKTEVLGVNQSPNLGPYTVLATGEVSMFLTGGATHGKYLLFDTDGNLINSVDGVGNGRLTFNADGSYKILIQTYSYEEHRLDRVVEYYDADGQLTSSVTQSPLDYGPMGYPYPWIHSYTLDNGNDIILWSPEYGVSNNASVIMRIVGADGGVLVADVTLEDFVLSDDVGLVELSSGAWVLTMGGKMQVFNADGSADGEPLPIIGSSGLISDDEGGWYNSYFGSRDGGTTYGFYSRTFHPNEINNAPVIAYNSSFWGTEDTPYVFSSYSFTGFEPDGDELTQIVIEALPLSGVLKFDGAEVYVGQVIDLASADKLVWTPPKDATDLVSGVLRYNIIDEHGARSTKPGEISIRLTGTDDPPVGEDFTLDIYEDERIALPRGIFPVSDVDGESLMGLDVTTVSNRGTFGYGWDGETVDGHAVIDFYDIDGMFFRPKRNESGAAYAEFDVKYVTGPGSMSETYRFTINVLAVNDAPEASNVQLAVNAGKKVNFIDQYFRFQDVEGDDLKSIVITDLPNHGALKVGGRAVKVGDEISASNILRMSYDASKNASRSDDDVFKFLVRDDGGLDNGGDDLSDKERSFTFKTVANPVISGSAHNDVLTGLKSRSEIFYGGEGNDRIIGGAGNDLMYGGAGRDVFQFGKKNGLDKIADFDVENDRIDLRQTDIPDFAFMKKHHSGSSPFNMLYLMTGTKEGAVGLIGDIEFKDLSADNFIF